MRDALLCNDCYFGENPMRTTLDIADDVLFAAKDFARRDKKTLG